MEIEMLAGAMISAFEIDFRANQVCLILTKSHALHILPNPTTFLSCSKIMSWRQVVGANLDQIGMNPFQNPSGPSFLKIFMAQSPNPL